MFFDFRFKTSERLIMHGVSYEEECSRIYIAETIDTVPKQSFGGWTLLDLAWNNKP